MKRYYVHVYFVDGTTPIEIECETFSDSISVVLSFDLPNVQLINIECYENNRENRTTVYVGSTSK